LVTVLNGYSLLYLNGSQIYIDFSEIMQWP